VWEGGKKGPKRWVARAYDAYSQGKQTLRELSARYGVDLSTLRRNFDRYQPVPELSEIPSDPVALVFDGTFFGRGSGWMVFRAHGKNIYWKKIESETLVGTISCLERLRQKGWRFSSFTIDGRKGVSRGIEALFPGVPVQLCIFHQKAIIRRYLTGKPKTDCGKAIKALSDKMPQISEADFTAQLAAIKRTFESFLAEKNGARQFVHRKLRSAIRSLSTNQPYLFAFQRYPELKIPTTTNTCDGSFAHWKSKVKLHRGLKDFRRSKMVEYLLKNP